MTYKERFEAWWSEWSYFKKKELKIWRENKKRGGPKLRAMQRLARQEESRELKEALYSDLEKGWMTGDFRMEVEHVNALKDGFAKIPLEGLEKIYLYYRSMQNETINRF
jgi:hypothetical protein